MEATPSYIQLTRKKENLWTLGTTLKTILSFHLDFQTNQAHLVTEDIDSDDLGVDVNLSCDSL